MPTHKSGAILEIILTHLANLYHPPADSQPLQVDTGKKGKDSDHNIVTLAPADDKFLESERSKKTIITRPITKEQMDSFGSELTQTEWTELYDAKNTDLKV